MSQFKSLCFDLQRLAKDKAGKGDIPAWMGKYEEQPIYSSRLDIEILENGEDSGRPVKVKIKFLPQVNIEGGYIVTFRENGQADVVRLELKRKTLTINPNQWIKIAMERLGADLVTVVVTATATQKIPNSNFSWELSDESVFIEKYSLK